MAATNILASMGKVKAAGTFQANTLTNLRLKTLTNFIVAIN